MKSENLWSERAKAPDPDDLSAESLPASETSSIFERRGPHTDYTDIEHHDEIPDSADSGDPSRPQGEFWHRNERPATALFGDDERSSRQSGEPIPVTPEARQGTDELPAVFFGEVKKPDE